ncbi:AAA family ATPase [Synechococcus elongatus]|uniref:AAA family ATPase n=1 Tax=Synechococcus elongatus PCC 11801 TaxID=2219813 RepID=A0AAN1UUT7_SYNEL|nr:AAA family ATPase [Synechococcus elongatus]AZB73009.1 AAA family ATPase [Synechococcus elongatus PCC 11801]
MPVLPETREASPLAAVLAQLQTVLLGKERQIQLAIACLLARGHLLIEDLPGMGKTLLSQSLANSLGLSYRRVQFTSDLLPADLLGVSIFEQQEQRFRFHPGPIFSQVLLADEINRASPKTQSALLEAMAERQVSHEGDTYPLPQPFFVIATQNPIDQAGTFAMPESQLDRFLMRLELGFPDHQAELAMLRGSDGDRPSAALLPILNADTLQDLQLEVSKVRASDPLLEYLLALVQESRQRSQIPNPLSPRASKAILAAAKAWAFLAGRDYVLPEDVQAIFPAVAEHRLRGSITGQGDRRYAESLLESVDPVR